LLNPQVPTVGASGAIFGVLGGLFILERKRHIATGGQVAGLIVLNLVITLAFSGSISVGGHFGGLAGGMVLMVALLHFRRSMLYSVLSVLALSTVAIVAAYFEVRKYR
jgi:membrane associated rhomboid family serine protease